MGGLNIYISMEETLGQLYGQSRRTFSNVTCLWLSNFATLDLETAVMQLRRSRGFIQYISALGFPIEYNKVYLTGDIYMYMSNGVPRV